MNPIATVKCVMKTELRERTERLTLVNDKLQRRTDAEPGQEPPVNLADERCGT